MAPPIPDSLNIALLSVHSSPLGRLGSRDTGGMSVYVRSLASELGRRGHHIDIFTRHSQGRNGPSVTSLTTNVRLIELKAGDNGYAHPSDLYPHLEAFFEAMERFRAKESLRYDLIHSHYWVSGKVGDWAQRIWEVPHAIMFHTLGAVKNSSMPLKEEPPLRVETEAQLARTCNRIVAATPREQIDLQHYYGADPERIRVVPCGVDLDLFRPLDRVHSRRNLGFGPDEAIVLFVGRFSPVKGLERLLEAVGLLREYPLLRLVLVGGEGAAAPVHEELRQRIAELGIKGLIRFAGQVEHHHLPAFYSSADVLVVPSHYESFGLVSLEALACGTPVVSTSVGAMEQLILQGETGCVVPHGSPVLLAECMLSILDGAGGRPEVRERARASVLGFSWSGVASAMAAQYVQLMSEFDH
jgi:D-inositol-3-phosphate glycosyltransferase